ncbi:MAG: hypothetical protein M3Y04_07625, partial [Actinomycetota bacterium]|nr:hypothetical protein [Actinomycetota bacterium]
MTLASPGIAIAPGRAPQPEAPATDFPRSSGALLGERERIVVVPRWAALLAAVIGQAVLARALSAQPLLVLAHALAILAVIGWAILRRKPEIALIAVAYLTSSEVLWRQTRGPIPAQTAPYLTIGAAFLAIVILQPRLSKIGRKAFLYIALLLPSSLVTIAVAHGTARQAISFALAGPFALAALVAWLSQVRVTTEMYRRVLWAIVISG